MDGSSTHAIIMGTKWVTDDRSHQLFHVFLQVCCEALLVSKGICFTKPVVQHNINPRFYTFFCSLRCFLSRGIKSFYLDITLLSCYKLKQTNTQSSVKKVEFTVNTTFQHLAQYTFSKTCSTETAQEQTKMNHHQNVTLILEETCTFNKVCLMTRQISLINLDYSLPMSKLILRKDNFHYAY